MTMSHTWGAVQSQESPQKNPAFKDDNKYAYLRSTDVTTSGTYWVPLLLGYSIKHAPDMYQH